MAWVKGSLSPSSVSEDKISLAIKFHPEPDTITLVKATISMACFSNGVENLFLMDRHFQRRAVRTSFGKGLVEKLFTVVLAFFIFICLRFGGEDLHCRLGLLHASFPHHTHCNPLPARWDNRILMVLDGRDG